MNSIGPTNSANPANSSIPSSAPQFTSDPLAQATRSGENALVESANRKLGQPTTNPLAYSLPASNSKQSENGGQFSQPA